MRHIGAVMAIGFLLASSAAASDGVIEINQTRALAGGITSGDTAGFPVTISAPGSYRLTGNLAVTSLTQGGVVISASWVTLDLGGFEIAGPVTCTGTGTLLSCSASNSTTGVLVGGLTSRARVQNGTVRGFGGIGVDLANGTAERLRVSENGGGGILSTLSSPSVIDSVVERNHGDGIKSLLGVVRGCTVSGNFGTGVVGQGTLIEGNLVRGNGIQGIHAGHRSVVRSNVVTGNTADGIVVLAGALVIDNASTLNGGAGIAALSTSSIQHNISQGNSGVGIYLFPEEGGSPSSYLANVITGNAAGTVSSGINMGENSCNGTSFCP